tara:strand:+ start:64 stop:966 length:903 start_codon:yes stop_codon:yes gene_type:complete
MDRKIFYTAGCHGNFIKYLFDCHDAGKMLPMPFNKNGNSHLRADTEHNTNIEVCSEDDVSLVHDTNPDNYAIVWNGFDSFFYAMSAYTDRGGHLETSGVALLEQDLKRYQDTYGMEVHIGRFLKDKLNYDIEAKGQPPRGVLRNYFLMSFYTHFEHVLWGWNNRLQQTTYHKIQLNDILAVDTLKSCLAGIFGTSLDIDNVHETFMLKNLPYKQLQQVNSVLHDIRNKKFREISGLDVISEAYILFRLEIDNFDIPFHVGNPFFATTQDVVDYIDHFPNYMKGPNNLFHKHHEHYQRGDS